MTLEIAAAPRSGGMPQTSGLNFFDEDPNLRFALSLRLAPEELALAEPLLREAGAVAGGEMDRLARLADQHPPRLVSYSPRGERIDEVEYHPAYTEMERIAFERFRLAAISHTPALFGWPGIVPQTMKYALSYVLVQSEFGLFCPVNMTDSLARVLTRFADPAIRDRFLPQLTAERLEDLYQSTQSMTEKTGGSDVGASETVARWEDGVWRLYGDKWFCSNVSADLVLTLARPEGAPPGTKGLGLFLMPRRLEDGTLNRYRINRLKEKLGSRSMATGELTLEGAFAHQIGALDRGFAHMMEMVNSSRLSNAMRAAAMTRRGLLEATVHARGRMAFGQRLEELPLMRETLLDLTLDSESAIAAVLHTGSVFSRADAGSEADARLLRVLTPLLKLSICKRARWSTGESMEVRGGNGYVEDWVDARLLRDSHLGSIWEGTSNVIALDVLRAITRDGCDAVLLADIRHRLDDVSDPHVRRLAALLSAMAERFRSRIENVVGLPEDERELPVRELAERLFLLYAASLLVEEAEVQAAAGSYRKLLVAAEFVRRRLTFQAEGWSGPRPGSGRWFAAMIGWEAMPAEPAVGLLDALTIP